MTAQLVQQAGETLERIRQRQPLIHQIANLVVLNDTANATLAIGAQPVMALDPAEVAEMAAQADALVLNLGTPVAERFTAMKLAGAAANAAGKPIVVDPVGYGATAWRTANTDDLLDAIHSTIVRGNAGEITRLCGADGRVRGVDSAGAASDLPAIAQRYARERGLVLSISGAVDLLTDGKRTIRVANGTPLLARITGSGCIATALTGCCAAVEPDALVAALAGALAIGIAGELAASQATGPGSFRTALIDCLASLTHDDIEQRARITVV